MFLLNPSSLAQFRREINEQPRQGSLQACAGQTAQPAQVWGLAAEGAHGFSQSGAACEFSAMTLPSVSGSALFPALLILVRCFSTRHFRNGSVTHTGPSKGPHGSVTLCFPGAHAQVVGLPTRPRGAFCGSI